MKRYALILALVMALAAGFGCAETPCGPPLPRSGPGLYRVPAPHPKGPAGRRAPWGRMSKVSEKSGENHTFRARRSGGTSSTANTPPTAAVISCGKEKLAESTAVCFSFRVSTIGTSHLTMTR